MLNDYYIQSVLGRYEKPEKNCYHNRYHVINMLQAAALRGWDGPILKLAILYHDIVYVPGSQDNETLSAVEAAHDMMMQGWGDNDISAVKQLIWSTVPFCGLVVAGHEEETVALHDLDWMGFAYPFTAIRNGNLIFNEFVSHGKDPLEVRRGQLRFYRQLKERITKAPLFMHKEFRNLNSGVPLALDAVIEDTEEALSELASY